MLAKEVPDTEAQLLSDNVIYGTASEAPSSVPSLDVEKRLSSRIEKVDPMDSYDGLEKSFVFTPLFALFASFSLIVVALCFAQISTAPKTPQHSLSCLSAPYLYVTQSKLDASSQVNVNVAKYTRDGMQVARFDYFHSFFKFIN